MLSPVGQQIALGCGSTVEIRDTSSGKLIHTLRGHSAGITALAWNAQGTLLASASWDGTACIWNLATGKAQKRIELSHQDRKICWSPDGEYLATIGNRDVQIWSAQRGTMECQYRDQHQIHAVAWSPDGRCVASGGWGNDITVWDAFTADAISVLTGHTSPITSLCWNPSGTRLASASEDRFVRIWDVETQGGLLSLRGNTDGVTSLAWSQDGMRIAAGDRLGQVIVWDALPGHLCEATPQALDVLNRRVEAHPTLDALATRADFLDKLGRAEEAREDRRRLRLIREERTQELLTDPIAVQSLADGLWKKIQSQDAACWRTLSPIRMTASSGATLTLESDKSIFVTGPNTAGVSYDIYVNVDTPVAALRLEAIPDARLPHGGSGRAAKNGNFHLAEIDVYALQSADSETGSEVAVDRYLEDEQLSLTGPTVGKAIDGNNRTHWDTYPNHKEPHWAVFQFAEPLSSETDEVVLRVRLDSGVSMWGPHGLGRFRLSATNDIDVVKRERMLQIVKTRFPDGAAFLGGTYAILGEKRKAAPAFAAALRQAKDPASRRATVALVAQFDEVAVAVAKLVPNDPWLMLFQADLLAGRGERERARQKREEALALLLEQVDENPETTLQALNEAAVAYQEAGCPYESLQLLRPSYEQSRRLLSDEHMQTLSLLDTLADVLVDVGRCEEARTLREKENSLRQKVLGPDHRSVLASGQKLAGLYARCGQISEAVSLHVRIAEAAPLNDMNATQQAAFFLTWQGAAERHTTLARTLLESARATDNAKVARDVAKAVLINPDVSPDLVEPAAALAKKGLELAPANTWSVLSLGMGDYRRGDFSQATTQLSRALDASSQRLRLLAHAFLAMAAFQRDDSESARKHLHTVETGIGLIAFADLESPFVLHHDDLAVWLALREARRTMHVKPLSAREAVEGSLEFQREVVRRSPGDTRKSLHLAVLYAWFKKEKEHSDLCQQLLTAAETSSQAADQERAAKAYLIRPSGESVLLPSAAASAETAVRRLENNDELRAWARMAAGMAAYRQQRYAEAVTLLTAAQESTNRFIRGPSLFFRSLAQLREGRRTQAIQDFDSAKELMQPFPNRLMVTEHILHHDQLVFWLAYDEANQEFATAFARRDSQPIRGSHL
jgi:tetratricopeptide (TPR) repeat protein